MNLKSMRAIMVVSMFLVTTLTASMAPAGGETGSGVLWETETTMVWKNVIDATGTSFSITGHEGEITTLTSDVKVHVNMVSMTDCVSINIETACEAKAAWLRLEGLSVDRELFRYQDGYRQEVMVTDGGGALEWKQDLTMPHHVSVQARESTVYIRSDGTVDPDTAPIDVSTDKMTFTLTDDLSHTLEIERPGIVLDGDGFSIDTVSPYGVYMYMNIAGVTVRDLVVRSGNYGISASYHCDDLVVKDCDIDADGYSIYHYHSDRCELKRNTMNGTTMLFYSDDSTVSDNSVDDGFIYFHNSVNAEVSDNILSGSSDHCRGITMWGLDDSVVSGNKVLDSMEEGLYMTYVSRCAFSQNEVRRSDSGMYSIVSDNCVLEDNLFVDNREHGVFLKRSEFFTLTGNTMSGSRFNLGITGYYYDPEDYTHYIDTTNTVGGKSVYYYVDQGAVPKTDFSDAGYIGLVRSSADVSNADVSNVYQAVLLLEASGTTVTDCSFSDCYSGIEAYYSDWCTFAYNVQDSGYYGMDIRSCHDCTIDGNELAHNEGLGIYMVYCMRCSVEDNIIDDANNGMRIISHSDHCRVIGNTFTNHGFIGLRIESATDCLLKDNIVLDSGFGIGLTSLTNSFAIGNEVLGTEDGGLTVLDCTNTVLEDNLVKDGERFGISIYNSVDITLCGNIMENNMLNFGMDGHYPSGHFDHSIDTTNTIDGKPIYYYVDVANVQKTDFSDAGYIGLVRSTASVSNADISNNRQCVLILDSPDVSVSNCQFSDYWYGLEVQVSTGCTIVGNTLNAGDGFGIRLNHGCHDAIIESNILTANLFGIDLRESDDCVLRNNLVDGIESGVTLSQDCYRTELDGNTIINHEDYGLRISHSCVMSNNVLANNNQNLRLGVIEGHDIDTSNVIDGKVLCYYSDVGPVAKQDFSDAALVVFIRSWGTIMSATLSHNSNGVILLEADGTDVVDCTVTDVGSGIYVHDSPGVNLVDCIVTDIDQGIFVRDSQDVTLRSNTLMRSEEYGIYILESSGSVVEENIVQDTKRIGLDIRYSDNCQVNGNTLKNISNGMYLEYSDGLSIVSNIIVDPMGSTGIFAWRCYEIDVLDNMVRGADVNGIDVRVSEDSEISGNIVRDCEIGILLSYGGSSEVTSNTVMDCLFEGMYISSSPNSLVEGNFLKGNSIGLFIGSSDHSLVRENIANANLEEGLYLSGDEMTVTSNQASKNGGSGLYLSYLTSSTVSDNTAKGNEEGLYINTRYSDDVTISGNSVSDNDFGVFWYIYSYGGTEWDFDLIGNTITKNGCGIHMDDRRNGKLASITTSGNEIKDNDVGIHVGLRYLTTRSSIYQNDMTKNTEQISGNVANIPWDDGAGHGNYWDDYAGLDDGSGGRTAGDGIGDTDLPHQGVDWYPYMKKVAG